MKRILLVKTSSLGDVIHNLPVVTDILQQHPDAHIDWLVEEAFADIPRLHPDIQQVITVAIRRWRKQLFSKKTWCEIASFKKKLSQQPYDLVIDTQGLIKSAVMSSFAQGSKHGMDAASAREPLASYFYDKKHPIARDQHAVTRNRQLAAQACGYTLVDNAASYGITARDHVLDFVLPQSFAMGLHGTSKESKLWPISHWIMLASQLSTQNLCLVMPWSTEAEHQRAQTVAREADHVIVLPKLSIAALASIIQQARVSIGVDTGLSHLSAALNIPTVAIYTDTNPARTGVMASAHSKAVNLGGVQQIPSVTSVLEGILQVTS